ncbi:MAG: hypothetical protein WD598_12200 [Acidimicrobiia bacterium]
MPFDLHDALSAAVPHDLGAPDVDAAWQRVRKQRRERSLGALATTIVVVIGTVLVLADGPDNRRISTPAVSDQPPSILALRAGQLVELSIDGSTKRVVARLAATAGQGGGLSVASDRSIAIAPLPLTDPLSIDHCPDSETRSGYALSRVDLATGAASEIELPNTASGSTDPTLSPDGTRFAYVEYQCQPLGPSTRENRRANALVVRDLDGNEQFRFALPQTSPDDGAQLEIFNIAGWEPNGHTLLIQVQHEPTAELWRVDTQDATPPTKLPTPADVRAISVTPIGTTGRWLADQSPGGSAQQPRIIEYDPDTGTALRTLFEWSDLPTDASSEVIASDTNGRHLLLVANFNGGPQVLYRWSEGDARPTKVAVYVTQAVWLPAAQAEPAATTTSTTTAPNPDTIVIEDVRLFREGECTTSDAAAVACSELHASEKYATFTIPGNVDLGDDILGPPAGEACNLLLELFTGTPMDEQMRYGVLLTGGLSSVPGSAKIECVVQGAHGGGGLDPTTGSARGELAVTWDRFPEWQPETGSLTAIGFNDFITEQQPAWARSPFLAAWMLTQLSKGEIESTAIQQQDLGEGRARVVVTISNLADDSTEASRYEFVFERGPDGLVRFASGTRANRCQPGRGDQDFSVEPCL